VAVTWILDLGQEMKPGVGDLGIFVRKSGSGLKFSGLGRARFFSAGSTRLESSPT
jgi:hypothetical protein